MISSVPSFMLLERENELSLLSNHLGGAASQGGKMVLVRGEAGIGKSTLVREFVSDHSEEAHVLVGFCDDLLTPHPLGPFWDIAKDEAGLSEHIRGGDRMVLMRALLDLMSRQLRPTVLVIEDSQWADEATLDVVKYLGRRIGGSNGLFMLTYRDGEVDYDHPLRHVIGELDPENLVRVHLSALTPDAVRQLVGDADADVEEIFSLTDGNPLLVSEVLASGVEGVPTSVEDSVLARASKLSDRARQLLELVSVVPRETEWWVIERILGPIEKEIGECVRRDLLRAHSERISFHHELTRRAVESALTEMSRRRLNQQILAEIADQSDYSRLVHHAREASDVDAIIRFAPGAARDAMATASYREAVAHFRLVGPHLDRLPEDDRAALYDDWAQMENHFSGGATTIEILDRATELHRSGGRDLELSADLVEAAQLAEMLGERDRADAYLTEALEVLESHPPRGELAYAIGVKSWVAMWRYDHSNALQLADWSLTLAEESGHDVATMRALNTKGSVMVMEGQRDGYAILDAAIKRAREAGLPDWETRAHLNLALGSFHRRDLDQALEAAEQGLELALQNEFHNEEVELSAAYAGALFQRGEWDRAEDIATETLAKASDPVAALVRSSSDVLIRLSVRRGAGEATELVEEAWKEAEASGWLANIVHAAIAKAELMWLHDDDDQEWMGRLGEVRDEPAAQHWPFTTGELAFRLWLLGDTSAPPEGVRESYRLITEGKPFEAVARQDLAGEPYELALVLMHGSEASQLQALEILEGLGAEPAVNKLRGLLKAKGITAPRGRRDETRRHPTGLTSRQDEVLQLLGERLTDNEIADRLFVSPRTVHHHVSAILSKFSVPNRSEVIVRARDLGLLKTVETFPTE